MTFAGIDFDSFSIDVALLNLDDDNAIHHRVELRKGDAYTRLRSVRERMPTASRWEDAGVVTVAIEEPKHNRFDTAVKIARIQGAIIACLPKTIDVIPLTPHEWRIALGLNRYPPKEVTFAWVSETWPPETLPSVLTQDAADAYAIAYAARTLCDRAAGGKGVMTTARTAGTAAHT